VWQGQLQPQAKTNNQTRPASTSSKAYHSISNSPTTTTLVLQLLAHQLNYPHHCRNINCYYHFTPHWSRLCPPPHHTCHTSEGISSTLVTPVRASSHTCHTRERAPASALGIALTRFTPVSASASHFPAWPAVTLPPAQARCIYTAPTSAHHHLTYHTSEGITLQ
jgi:hypothetical protein